MMKQETYEPAPSGTLNTSGGGIELLLERIERPEALHNGVIKRTSLQGTTITLALAGGGRQVLPEERMVDMT
jgi:hypothetical protein